MNEKKERKPTPIDPEVLELANTLKILRKANGLTQKEVSAATGIDRGNLAKFETGKLQLSLPTMLRLCRVLNCNLSITFNMEEINSKAKTKDGRIERELFTG